MPFFLDYMILIFLASVGVIQLAALKNGLKGIYLVRPSVLNLALALALTCGSFIWFFTSEPRNLPDDTLGLDGNRQAGFYLIGSVGAVVFTLLVTSLLHRVYNGKALPSNEAGLDALRSSGYATALKGAFIRLWKR